MSTKPETAGERGELIRIGMNVGMTLMPRMNAETLLAFTGEALEKFAAALLAEDGKAWGEVVAWRVSFDGSAWTIYEYDPTDRLNARYITVQPLYTHPQPAQVAQPLTDRKLEIFRAERDLARAQVDRAVALLTGIHSLLYPPKTTTADGRVMVFRPKSPDPHEVLQELSDRIRALPDEIDAHGIGKDQA